MKQLSIILCLVLCSLTFYSCGNDEPDGYEQNNWENNDDNNSNTDVAHMSESQIMSYLTSPEGCWITHDFVEYQLIFTYPNNITYIQQSTHKMGNYSHAYLTAKGTFSINKNTITANFTSIWWEPYSNSYWKNGNGSWFPGWERYGTKTVRYEIHQLSYDELAISDDLGHNFYMSSHK